MFLDYSFTKLVGLTAAGRYQQFPQLQDVLVLDVLDKLSKETLYLILAKCHLLWLESLLKCPDHSSVQQNPQTQHIRPLQAFFMVRYIFWNSRITHTSCQSPPVDVVVIEPDAVFTGEANHNQLGCHSNRYAICKSLRGKLTIINWVVNPIDTPYVYKGLYSNTQHPFSEIQVKQSSQHGLSFAKNLPTLLNKLHGLHKLSHTIHV